MEATEIRRPSLHNPLTCDAVKIATRPRCSRAADHGPGSPRFEAMDDSVYVTTGSIQVSAIQLMMDEPHVKVWTVVLGRDALMKGRLPTVIGYDGPDDNEVMVGYPSQSHPTKLYPRLPDGWSVIADVTGMLVRIVAYELPHGAAWWYPTQFRHDGSHPPG